MNACALVISGSRLGAVRSAVTLPIIGIIKHRHGGFEPDITSMQEEIETVIGADAGVVATTLAGGRRQSTLGDDPSDFSAEPAEPVFRKP